MARRYVSADPTANTAIRRADRASRDAASAPRQRPRQRPRKLLVEFPDIFDGLLPHEAKAVAFEALRLAGGNVWAISLEQLEQARDARRPRR